MGWRRRERKGGKKERERLGITHTLYFLFSLAEYWYCYLHTDIGFMIWDKCSFPSFNDFGISLFA